MSIQYKHVNPAKAPKVKGRKPKGHTFAMQVPDKEHLLSVGEGDMIAIPFGMGTVHENDSFDKRIGRHVAEGRMATTFFMLDDVDIGPAGQMITLSNGKTRVKLSVRNDKPLVKFYAAWVE